MNLLTAKVARAAKNTHMGKMPRRKTVKLHGKEVTLYSIGWLAHMTERHPHTIRQYEKRKILPEPILKTKSKKRWYTAEEISGYAAIIKAANLRPKVPIESTGLRDSLCTFRNNLRARIGNNLHQVQLKLKEEKDVYDYANGMRANLVQRTVQATFPT